MQNSMLYQKQLNGLCYEIRQCKQTGAVQLAYLMQNPLIKMLSPTSKACTTKRNIILSNIVAMACSESQHSLPTLCRSPLMRMLSPTSKACTTNKNTTLSNMVAMALLKMKLKATIAAATAVQMCVTSTYRYTLLLWWRWTYVHCCCKDNTERNSCFTTSRLLLLVRRAMLMSKAERKQKHQEKTDRQHCAASLTKLTW